MIKQIKIKFESQGENMTFWLSTWYVTTRRLNFWAVQCTQSSVCVIVDPQDKSLIILFFHLQTKMSI